MAKSRSASETSNIFIIIYEIVLGLIELVLGFGIAFYGERVLVAYQALRATDFLSEQNDLLTDILERLVPYLTTHKLGVSVLLIALGGVKIASAIGLILKKEWGRHLLIGLLVVLIPFDLVGLLFDPSIFEAAYLAIDVLIILYMIEFNPKEYFAEVKELFN